MLAFIFNFGTLEIFLVVIVAVLVFGRNLPTVAVQAAEVVQRLRRSLADLRRETGIDEELRKARRTIDAAVPREVRRMDVREIVRRQVEEAGREPEPGSEKPSGSEKQPAELPGETTAAADEDPPVSS